MSTPTIKQLLDDVRSTLGAVAVLKSVVRPAERVPGDGPFALVEFAGANVVLSNLEETTYSVRVTVCVPMKGAYPLECEAVEAVVPEVLTKLRGNVQLAGQAMVVPQIEVGATTAFRYAEVMLVGVAITIQAQAYSERANEFVL